MFDVKGLVCRLICLSSEGKYFPYKSSLNKRKERHVCELEPAHTFLYQLFWSHNVACVTNKTFNCCTLKQGSNLTAFAFP